MKRFFHMLRLTAFLLCALLLLASCASSASGAKSTEELTRRYLDAIMSEKYEAVLDLLPAEVVEYGMKELDGGREDVVEYVKYASYDYHWLSKLPTNVDYSFEMTQEESVELDARSGKERYLLEEDGVKLYVQDAVSIRLSVQAGGAEPIRGSLFAVRIDGRWYLTSVAGDDELFYY